MSRVVSPFEDGLEDRLLGQYPEHRDAVAAAISKTRDMIRRKRVRNPNGLLVSSVRSAVATATTLQTRAFAGGDSELYASLLVQIFDEAIRSQLGPAAIARALQHARQSGYGKLNPVLIEKLEAMGEYWPGSR